MGSFFMLINVISQFLYFYQFYLIERIWSRSMEWIFLLVYIQCHYLPSGLSIYSYVLGVLVLFCEPSHYSLKPLPIMYLVGIPFLLSFGTYVWFIQMFSIILIYILLSFVICTFWVNLLLVSIIALFPSQFVIYIHFSRLFIYQWQFIYVYQWSTCCFFWWSINIRTFCSFVNLYMFSILHF